MAEAAFVLVDDEKSILKSLKQELRRSFGRDYLYETAESVDEAWGVIDELDQDGAKIVVVVSDWLMPHTRGDAFLIELSERHPNTLRIMLTGHAAESAVARLWDRGAAHEVLSKPWDSEHLRDAILKGLGS
jgi:DNA-binding NtrC family response regulator